MIEKEGGGRKHICWKRAIYALGESDGLQSSICKKNTALISRFSGGIYNGFNNASLNKGLKLDPRSSKSKIFSLSLLRFSSLAHADEAINQNWAGAFSLSCLFLCQKI